MKNSPCHRSGKRRHATRKRALTAAAFAMKERPGTRLTIYKCPHCHDWHLTKKETREPETRTIRSR